MIYTVIYILISLIITEYIAKGSIKKLLLLNPLYIILTTIIIYIIILPLLMLFNNITWLILLLTSIILLSLGVSNKIKIDYRQTGFTPIDFLILKEATSMSGALNKKSMKVLFIKFSLILILFTALTFYFKNKADARFYVHQPYFICQRVYNKF